MYPEISRECKYIRYCYTFKTYRTISNITSQIKNKFSKKNIYIYTFIYRILEYRYIEYLKVCEYIYI